MRKILFRGKRMDNRQWIHGEYDARNKEVINHEGAFQIDPRTLGECTGVLAPLHGFIYEGDILNGLLWDKTIEESGGKRYHEHKTVFFSNGCFVVDVGFDCMPIREFVYDSIVVVGNIHDDLIYNY